MRGGFSKKMEALRQELIQFKALIELELDFSEEEVEFANLVELRSLLNKLHKDIQNYGTAGLKKSTETDYTIFE